MARRVKQLERILGLLRESSGPVDAHHLAATLDLHVTTVRFHLAASGRKVSSAPGNFRPSGSGARASATSR
ncbi:hypothetical protein NXT08_18790 [Rhodococcus pyridinivorans]|uniref:hypothetical protein n=1 Tax=Rhodococcus TaxID=1827 RepID=UPI001E5D323F|nr:MULTISPECIES: hypothetical protein [Rhodococcus]UVT24305.1 hypothetical protein NXT08_18790 [Rhodococcus pyridinivorans]